LQRQFVPAPSGTKTLAQQASKIPVASAAPIAAVPSPLPPPPTPVEVFTDFKIQPLPRTTQTALPVVTPIPVEPFSGITIPIWLPTVVVIISVIAGLQGAVGALGAAAAVLKVSTASVRLPGTVDFVHSAQTIVITGAIGLGTSDVYPTFVSSFLWLFGIFKVNP
jgi:hypothetical protein